MKAFWKALGIAALAAAVPVRFQKNKETGKKKIQSLLISVDIGPGEDDTHTAIGINLGEGLLTDLGRSILGAKREAAMFTDDPAEAAVDTGLVQTAADEAQAGAETLQAEAEEARAEAGKLQAETEEAKAAAGKLQAEAEEARAEAGKLQAKAEEAKAAADKLQAEAEEAVEADFDPEF